MDRGTMLAAILEETDKDLVVERVELPKQLEYGQVLVKVMYSGICGSQLGEIHGVKGEDRYLPHLLGHEGSGIVVELGKGITSLNVGDRVVLHWKRGYGIEAKPPVYTWKGKRLNAGCITTFNEYAVVSENRATVIPKDFDLKLAALLGCAVTTGLGVVSHDANLKIGESIVVLGVGGVGLSVVQGAAMTCAYPIIAVDLFDEKLDLAEKFGATHVINGECENIEEEVYKILGLEGADVVVENTGVIKNIEIAYELAQKQGRIILVGVPKKDHKASLYSLPLHFGKVLKGSHGGGTIPQRDIPRYVDLIRVGKLNLTNLLSDCFAFKEVNKALDKMRSGKISGRCVLKMGA